MSATLLEAARALAPELSERALEGEQLRTMPLDLVEKVRSAGLFNLILPAELGGHQCDPLTVIEIFEELSRADGSAGWTTLIGNTGGFLAWLEPEVAKEMLAPQPQIIASGVFAPMGLAVPDETGETLTLNGRWPFNSGCPHADWFMSGAIVMDGDAPRMLPTGMPDWRFFWYPAAEGEIVDTWHVAGLKGTGSHDVAAHDVRVPVERTCAPFFQPAKVDGALYRLPFPTMLAAFLSGFPLGAARRAIDEFMALAPGKSRAVPPGPTLAQDESVQVELARAEGLLRSARSYLFDAMGDAWDTVNRGDAVSDQQRANVSLAALNAARAARTAVEMVFTMSGGGALYDASPIQRCVRDLDAGTQHIFFSPSRWKTVGRLTLGIDPGTFLY